MWFFSFGQVKAHLKNRLASEIARLQMLRGNVAAMKQEDVPVTKT
jgi:hypothetical protein